MNFQEQMHDTLRTKDDIYTEAVNRLMHKIRTAAESDFAALKRGLLQQAEQGSYTVINGQKMLTSTYPVMTHYEEYRAIGTNPQWFLVQIEDRSIAAVYDKRTRRFIKPYEFHNIVHFLHSHDAGKDLYMAAIKRLADAEGIQVALAVQEYNFHSVYLLPSTHYDMRKNRAAQFHLVVQATYYMPESGVAEAALPQNSLPEPDIFSFTGFVQALKRGDQWAQEETNRMNAEEKRRAEETAKKAQEPQIPLSSSLAAIVVLIGGWVLAVNLGGGFLTIITMLGSTALGYLLLKGEK